MVDGTSICELEISMCFVDLLEVCLQKATSYAASEHDVYDLREEISTRYGRMISTGNRQTVGASVIKSFKVVMLCVEPSRKL